MIVSALYDRIWREMQRQLNIGAITRRGRPCSDPEQSAFHRETRAWNKALQSMPSEMRREWVTQVSINYTDILGPLRTADAKKRAYIRGIKRIQSGLSNVEPALASHTSHRSKKTAERLLVVQLALASLAASGSKVTAKFVAQEVIRLFGAPYAVATDTTRKDIAKIRHDRHK